MSSPEDDERDERDERSAPSADEVTDPALRAEIANPAEANVPTGTSATPGETSTAADREPLAAPGAPGELSSDEVPPQGTGEGEAVRTEEPDQVPPPPTPAEDEAVPPSPEPAGGTDDASAVVPEQPAAPPAQTAETALAAEVAEATATKEAEAERATEPLPAAPEPEREAEPDPGDADPARQALLDDLRSHLGDDLVGTHLLPGKDVWARVRPGSWRRTAEVCRRELGLTYFGYLSAIDWLPSPFGKREEAGGEPEVAAQPTPSADLEHGVTGGATRFQLLARLLSVTSHIGLTLKADVPDDSLQIESLVPVFPGADWHEREAWEMYGIDFAGHPGLVHLYLPGAFEGHPQRKDFPLLAREVKPWPGLVDVEAMPGEAPDTGEAGETAEAEAEA